jgi:hypothetical protein
MAVVAVAFRIGAPAPAGPSIDTLLSVLSIDPVVAREYDVSAWYAADRPSLDKPADCGN